MFYDIITLDPNTYIKKSKKSSDFTETDEFIGVLQQKFNKWNIKYSCNNKVSLAHKIKFDQFENDFFKQSHLIIYIVSLFSEVGFRDSIKKLINSCQDKEKLTRVIIISLDKDHFVELNYSNIDLVHFGDDIWRSEEDKQWIILEELLHIKLHTAKNNNSLAPLRTNAATMPLPIPRHKSSSKIKSFFNSLPAKFDLDRKVSFKNKTSKDIFNESVPNIKISTSHEENSNKESGCKNIELRHKEDHTRLSLSSLFRKRSRKTRDSGLSATSSASNNSDSKYSKGQFIDMVFDVSREPSPACERSTVIHTSSLEKTKTYRAKIHMFKEKATNYFHSASCLNSPENKRRKNTDDTSVENTQFSSDQIVAFSDLLINEIKPPGCDSSLEQRGHSEPPMSAPVPNGLLKYYSWNGDLNESKDFILGELTCNDFEIRATLLQPTNKIAQFRNEINDSDNIIEDMFTRTIITNAFSEDDGLSSIDRGVVNCETKISPEDDLSNPDVFVVEDISSQIYSEPGSIKEPPNKDLIDDNYFQVNYAPNLDNSPRKTGKHTVTFKIDGLDSLENIMESIQKSCNDMKIRSKSDRDTDTALKTFKSQSGNNVSQKEDENHERKEWILLNESKYLSSTAENQLVIKGACHSNSLSPLPPIRSESNQDSSHSFLYMTTQTIVKNPFIVMGMFTATAITAPIWSTYIPHDVNLGQLLYGTFHRIAGNEIVQSIPGQLTYVATKTATAATNSLRRLLVILPNGHSFLNSYRVIFN